MQKRTVYKGLHRVGIRREVCRPSDSPCEVQAVACGGYGGKHQIHHTPLVVKEYAVQSVEIAGNLADLFRADSFHRQLRYLLQKFLLASSSEVMIFPQPGQLLLSSRFVQRRYDLREGLKILIRAYPQFPHLIFPASHVRVAFRADWIFMLFISFLRQVSPMSEGTISSRGASTSIWSFKSFYLPGFTSRP